MDTVFDTNYLNLEGWIKQFTSTELPYLLPKRLRETDYSQYYERSEFQEILNTHKSLITTGVIISTLIEYNNLKTEYSNLFPNDSSNVDSYFQHTLRYLIDIQPTQIINSITPDYSIYFRAYTENNEELHLEVYYDYDENEEDDVEAVVSLYNREDNPVLKYYGTLEEVFSEINKRLKNKSTSDTVPHTTGLHEVSKDTALLES